VQISRAEFHRSRVVSEENTHRNIFTWRSMTFTAPAFTKFTIAECIFCGYLIVRILLESAEKCSKYCERFVYALKCSVAIASSIFSTPSLAKWPQMAISCT
jgi:hypothetical protein